MSIMIIIILIMIIIIPFENTFQNRKFVYFQWEILYQLVNLYDIHTI